MALHEATAPTTSLAEKAEEDFRCGPIPVLRRDAGSGVNATYPGRHWLPILDLLPSLW